VAVGSFDVQLDVGSRFVGRSILFTIAFQPRFARVRPIHRQSSRQLVGGWPDATRRMVSIVRARLASRSSGFENCRTALPIEIANAMTPVPADVFSSTNNYVMASDSRFDSATTFFGSLLFSSVMFDSLLFKWWQVRQAEWQVIGNLRKVFGDQA